jgi:hypothetical protein
MARKFSKMFLKIQMKEASLNDRPSNRERKGGDQCNPKSLGESLVARISVHDDNIHGGTGEGC